MAYRTKTYIAGDWDGDKNAVDQLYKWKESNRLSLDFHDAHDLTQARDSSLNCSIKRSLGTRLDASKTFVLIVGSNTKTVRSGSCQYCARKNGWGACDSGYYVDNRSYIEYECDKAKEAYNEGNMKIVVSYYAATVDKSKCPDAVKYVGTHKAMCYYENGNYYWDYQAVKDAIG